MAKFKGNVIMKNVRGTIGKQVLVKSYLGTEYMCASPEYDDNRAVSKAEQTNRDRFSDSTKYAKEAMKIPELKALYHSLRIKSNHTAYITAKLDATYHPEITALITQVYSGKAGSMILVQAKDVIKVNRVKVIICKSRYEVLEEGEAVNNGDGFNWLYTALTDVNSLNGVTIEAYAYDIAGNETVKMIKLLKE
jgi:hypothetical protein